MGFLPLLSPPRGFILVFREGFGVIVPNIIPFNRLRERPVTARTVSVSLFDEVIANPTQKYLRE